MVYYWVYCITDFAALGVTACHGVSWVAVGGWNEEQHSTGLRLQAWQDQTLGTGSTGSLHPQKHEQIPMYSNDLLPCAGTTLSLHQVIRF
jgi:hypothetical protein